MHGFFELENLFNTPRVRLTERLWDQPQSADRTVVTLPASPARGSAVPSTTPGLGSLRSRTRRTLETPTSDVCRALPTTRPVLLERPLDCAAVSVSPSLS